MRVTNFKKLRHISVLLFFALFVGTSTSQVPTNTQQPNIVVFLVDDMGVMDTSVPFLTNTKGQLENHSLNQFYNTPNLEVLALQGIRFSNFYAHSVCSPTRASILTGQNSARHGTTNWINSENNNRTEYGPKDWNWKGLTKNSVTLPRLFQEAGYKTIHVGKAHFGPINSEGENPINLGFDVNIAGSSIGEPGSYYGEDGYGHINGRKSRAVPGLDKYHGTNTFLTEALTLEAIEAISKAQNENKPFFLYMSHYAVHTPFQSDPRFLQHYNNTGKEEKARAYASLIEGIDKSLGDIVEHLKSSGLGKNTLLLFLGDNGSDAPFPIVDDYSSAAPLKGKKGNHWEGGMRVPFIASWVSPDINIPLQKNTPVAQGKVQTQMGTILDIFPSLCAVAKIGLPKNHPLDGYDLHTQWKGETNSNRKELFLNHFPHGDHRSNYFTSMVKGHWKIVYHYPVLEESPRYELYNLSTDPFETENLAARAPKKARRLVKIMAKELNRQKALFPQNETGRLSVAIY